MKDTNHFKSKNRLLQESISLDRSLLKNSEGIIENIANSSDIIDAGKLSIYAINEKQLVCTYTQNSRR